MALKVSSSEMQQGSQMVKVTGGGMSTYAISGVNSSMMVATRHAGYHSRPHIHAAEQLNYVLDGQIIIFVGEKAFELKKGDFLRIPSMAIHWSWIKFDEPCTMVQSFTPPHERDRPGSVTLLDDDETIPAHTPLSSNYMVSDDYMWEVEEATLGVSNKPKG